MRFFRHELLAGVILVLVLIGIPMLAISYQLNRVSDYYMVTVNQESGFSPAEIYVKPGEQVKLQIHSKDVTHGFQSSKLRVSIAEIYPGKPLLVEFTAPSEPGEYSFSCAIRCGTNHSAMVGKVIVVGP